MTSARVSRVSFITSAERDLIRYQLELSTRPDVIKMGLQRLCSLYESGKLLAEPAPFRTLVSGLVWNKSTVVRRWAYKALAYIGDHSNVELLRDRILSERDRENLTWIVSAAFSLLDGWSLGEMRSEFGVGVDDAIALAALLFRRSAVRDDTIPAIDIERADPLTLKWCALLAGYEKAPPNLFHPKIENAQLLSALNAHDEPEVSEYSVWAMWKASGFRMDDLAIPLHGLHTQPTNVKRWTNRLLVKDKAYLEQNLDFFDEMGRDSAASAREGLALGIVHQHVDGLDDRVLQWYLREEQPEIKELLLEHMAAATFEQPEYRELLVDQYVRAGLGSGLRKRLLASARKPELIRHFKQVDFAAKVAADPDLFPTGPLGSLTLNNTTFNVGRDLLAQNLAGGNLVAVANESIQHIKNEAPEVADVLQKILEFAQSGALQPQQSEQLTAAVANVAKEPTPANKGVLLGTLNALATTVSAASAATKLPELIEAVSGWF